MKHARYLIIPFVVAILILVFTKKEESNVLPANIQDYDSEISSEMDALIRRCPENYGFDFPVGKPSAEKYFDMQPYGKNNHLGEDWNRGFRDDDLGDPVYSVSRGIVSFTGDLGGDWGNVIRIIHRMGAHAYVESLYAHLRDIYVKRGTLVERGEEIGTIGNNEGRERAHLHFEMRSRVGMPIGPGYSKDNDGYINPTKFIKRNR